MTFSNLWDLARCPEDSFINIADPVYAPFTLACLLQSNFCCTSVLTWGRLFTFYIQSTSLVGPQPLGHCQAEAPFTISHHMRKVTAPRKGNLVLKSLHAPRHNCDHNGLLEKGFCLQGNSYFSSLNKLCS